jgi:hypothetical protein
MPDWLELELAQSVAPVEAPDELWDRIQGRGYRPAPPARSARPVWAIAAIVTVMITAGAFWFTPRGSRVAGSRPDVFATHDHPEATCKLCHASM